MIRSVVRGTGSFLPERVLSNDEMAKLVDMQTWILPIST